MSRIRCGFDDDRHAACETLAFRHSHLVSQAEIPIPADLDGCLVHVEAVRLSVRTVGGETFSGEKWASLWLGGNLSADSWLSPRGLINGVVFKGSSAGGDRCGLSFSDQTALRTFVRPGQSYRFQFEGDPVTAQPMEVPCFAVDIRTTYSAVRGVLMDKAHPSHVYTSQPLPTPQPCRSGVFMVESKDRYMVSRSGQGPTIEAPGYSNCVIREIETSFSLYSPDLAVATRGGRATVRLLAEGRYNDGVLIKDARWSGHEVGGQCPDPSFILRAGGADLTRASPPYVGIFRPHGDSARPDGSFDGWKGKPFADRWRLAFYDFDGPLEVDCWKLKVAFGPR